MAATSEIAREYLMGSTVTEIAKKRNVFPMSITRILRRSLKEKYVENSKKRNPLINGMLLSPELSYVIGVFYSDGSISKAGRTHAIRLTVKDYDFLLEFNKCVSKILNRKKLYAMNKTKDGRYDVHAYSNNLYGILAKPFEEIKPIIEANPMEFIKGFADGDGGVSWLDTGAPCILFSNTDLALLLYIKNTLKECFKIDSFIKKASIKGKIRKFPHGYSKLNKDCYQLVIARIASVTIYKNSIGFAINRKNEKLSSLLLTRHQNGNLGD